MKGLSLRLVFAVALAAGVLAPAALPSKAAASSWNHSCQAVQATFKYQSGSNNSLVPFTAQVAIYAVGCWNGSTTWIAPSSHNFLYADGDTHAGPNMFVTPTGWISTDSAGDGQNAGVTSYWVNATEHANAQVCSELRVYYYCSGVGGTFGIRARLELRPLGYPWALQFSNWSVYASCSRTSAADVSGGCIIPSAPTIYKYASVAYYQ
jgi:hypothetical protein